MVTRAASIDIGTNTIRLLIADVSPDGTLTPLRCERIITRLGEGFPAVTTLSRAARDRTLQALASFTHLIREYRASSVHASATSAVREATNSEDFIFRVERQTGITVRVITGPEEARITLRGVLASVAAPEPCLVVDIGGGSTELIVPRNRLPLHTASIRLGAVYLSEQLHFTDPPSRMELLSLDRRIKAALDQEIARNPGLQSLFPSSASARLIGTAGTITTLAAIDQRLAYYDPHKINSHLLTRERIRGIFRQLTGMSRDLRKTVPGLEPGREDLIIPGTAILLNIMDRCGFDTLTVSEGGLLEGMLIDAHGPQCLF